MGLPSSRYPAWLGGSGGTVLGAGTLRLADNAAAGAGALSLRDGTTLALDDGLAVGNAIDVAGAATVDVAGTASIEGDYPKR